MKIDQEILTLLGSNNDVWHGIGEQMLLEGMPGTFSTAMHFIASTDEAQGASVVSALRGQYVFLRGGYSSAEVSDADCSIFSNLQQDYRQIILQLRDCPDSYLKSAYKLFEGIREDIQGLHPDIDFTQSLRDEERGVTGGHQLMVFVTGLCNLNCSYCFSSDIERQYISLADLNRIFDWAEREGCKVVTPCGGEPLVYPHIKDFLDLVKKKGMTTYFASNCTLPLSDFSEQQLHTIDLITFHLTSTLWSNPEYMDIFCRNIELAKEYGIEIIARANIFRPDMDIDRWFSIIDRYNLQRLNIALTIPSGAHDNEFIDIRMFSDYVDIITGIIERCVERGIELSFAKPIPPCVFDDRTSRWMLRYIGFQPFCNISEDGCTRNVAMSPDMKLTPCLGVAMPEVKFDENLSWNNVSESLGAEVHTALRKPLFEKCPGCFLYQRRICQGACLSYKYLCNGQNKE